MRVLVTGCAGMLGRATMTALDGGHDVSGVDLADGDLTDEAAVVSIFAAHRPEWVVHTAAYTDVDGAESDYERARAVNAGATAHLVAACDRVGAGLAYVSTDYVFDGLAKEGYDEDTARDPLNAYGRAKAEGEVAVESMSGPRQIVRTSWLFGPGPRNFVLAIRRHLAERDVLRVVDDQRGCPTYAPDLAQVLRHLVDVRVGGVFHATNAGSCTWHDFAREIARLSGTDPRRIEACGTDAFPTPARRPGCSILHSARLERCGCPPRPSWQEALGRYIAWLDETENAKHGDDHA